MTPTKEQAKEALKKESYGTSDVHSYDILSSLIDSYYDQEELLGEMVTIMKEWVSLKQTDCFNRKCGECTWCKTEAILAKVEEREE